MRVIEIQEWAPSSGAVPTQESFIGLAGGGCELIVDTVKGVLDSVGHSAHGGNGGQADECGDESVFDQILTGFILQQIIQNGAIVLHVSLLQGSKPGSYFLTGPASWVE